MSNHKTATHQNLSVWARRMNMTLPDIDAAAKFADSMLGAPTRRGVLMALAIKYVSDTTGLPKNNSEVRHCGIAIGQALYDITYGDKGSAIILVAFHESLLEMVKILNTSSFSTVDALNIFLKYSTMAVNFITNANQGRNGERHQPSITNAIIAKVNVR